MKRIWNLILIASIIAVWVVAYSIVTNPYNQAKRDKVFLGPDNASIIIVSFVDYTNGDSVASEFTMKMLRQNYKNDIKFIYKYYNSSNLSLELAMAAECAAAQEKFEKMHDIIFNNYLNLSSGIVFTLASEAGLRKDDFRLCMENELYRQSVLKDYQLAQKMKIDTIPTIYIGGERIEGLKDLTYYSEIIEEKLD